MEGKDNKARGCEASDVGWRGETRMRSDGCHSRRVAAACRQGG